MPEESTEIPDIGPAATASGPDGYRRLVEVIKSALRAHGLTYAELAGRIGMSASGVKKLLNADDAGFGRLSDIAAVLGVPLGELIEASQRGDETVELSEAAQRYFLAQPRCFAFYWKLAVEGMTPAEIGARFGVSEERRERYLTALQSLGLVARRGGEVRLESRHPARPGALVRWAEGGPLLAQLDQRWARELADEGAASATRGDGAEQGRCFRLHFVRVRRQTREAMLRALQDVVDTYRRQAQREALTTARDELLPLSLLVTAAPRSFVEKV
ncbi:MAG: helix-turn-helix transcriptional regulator [Myxococcales bacterium]|nr:helix-turn-helix transcriptional regulator [Myxococcales bacterium]